MRKKFHDLLHQYRVEAFKVTHDNDHLEEMATEIKKGTEEALNNAYEYHFHEDDDLDRLDAFNRIKNFTIEAILPPVLEKVLRRVYVLEKQHEQTVQLIDNMLEILSEDHEKIKAATAEKA